MNPPLNRSGSVLKHHANFYYVESQGILFACSVKGLLKKEGLEVWVGDLVLLDTVDEPAQTARITRILPRHGALQRPKVANIDQAVIVHPLAEPDFDFRQLDRYLTHCAVAGVSAVLCISKSDLPAPSGLKESIRSLYQDKLGYPVFFTSIYEPDSLNKTLETFMGKTSVLAGLSGAGKSSILNRLKPGLNLKVGEISERSLRGQHTTRHVELIELSSGTYIADTPGFSNLKFDSVLPLTLEAAMQDFDAYRSDCLFSDCLHTDEQGCAVQAHLSDICPSRFASYLDMLAEARVHQTEVSTSSRKSEFSAKLLDGKGQKPMRILRLRDKDRETSRRSARQDLKSRGGFQESEPAEPSPDLL